ncbi:MAG: flavodoxin-dependent (E)-4-hydroxy-3-methylbut-2-enyl-diphosphate synthase [bacterium JZ-2024 1]
MKRRKTIEVKVGNKIIGGNHPIWVQSMLKTPLSQLDEALKETEELERAGVEILRVAVPSEKDVPYLKLYRKQVSLPLVADIHFRASLAWAVMEAGVDKIRFNPGNTRSGEEIRKIVRAAKQSHVAIRLGVNVGSLPSEFYIEYADRMPEAMVRALLFFLKDCEVEGFDQLVISLKSSRVRDTVEAYRMLAEQVPYPFHIGITEAGMGEEALIKSAMGIGALLLDGIGDTIRVSLAGPSVDEVRVGFEILRALELRKEGFDLIACPTCGRVRVDVVDLSQKVQKVLRQLGKPSHLIRVSVLGCEVNGPGEARMADIGVAGGIKTSTVYFRGKPVERIPNDQLEKILKKYIQILLEDEQKSEHIDSRL